MWQREPEIYDVLHTYSVWSMEFESIALPPRYLRAYFNSHNCSWSAILYISIYLSACSLQSTTRNRKSKWAAQNKKREKHVLSLFMVYAHPHTRRQEYAISFQKTIYSRHFYFRPLWFRFDLRRFFDNNYLEQTTAEPQSNTTWNVWKQERRKV